MPVLETCLMVLLALWALGSVMFLFRIPGVHGFFRRVNRCAFFVRWELFSTSDPSLRAGTFELRFRDRGPGLPPGEWRTAASGFVWSWRAFLWMPERYRASALQNIGRHVKSAVSRPAPLSRVIADDTRVLARYLERQHPLANGASREARLLRCFPSGVAPEELVVTLPTSVSAHER